MRATGWISFASTPGPGRRGRKSPHLTRRYRFRGANGVRRRGFDTDAPIRSAPRTAVDADLFPDLRRPFPRSAQTRSQFCTALISDLRPVQTLDPGGEHLVDESVLERLVGGEDLVALDVVAHLLLGPAAVLGQQPLQQRAHPQDLVGLDL